MVNTNTPWKQTPTGRIMRLTVLLVVVSLFGSNASTATAYETHQAGKTVPGGMNRSVIGTSKAQKQTPRQSSRLAELRLKYGYTLLWMAEYLLKQKEYKKAIEIYTFFLELAERKAEGYYGRSIAYARLGEFQKAVEDYNNAVKIDNRQADMFYRCLLILRECIVFGGYRKPSSR